MIHIDDSIAAHAARSDVKPHHAGLLRAIAAFVPDPWADQPTVRISKAKLVERTGYTSEDTVKEYLKELVNLGCIRKGKTHNRDGTEITLLRPANHDGVEPHPAEPAPDSVIEALAMKWLRDGETEPVPLTDAELQAVRVLDLMRRTGLVERPKKSAKKPRVKAERDEWSNIAAEVCKAAGLALTKGGKPKAKYWLRGAPAPWAAIDAGSEATTMDTSKIELLTVPEVAALLRTTPKAIYAMKSRGQIPGVVELSGRVRFHADVIRKWIADSTIS